MTPESERTLSDKWVSIQPAIRQAVCRILRTEPGQDRENIIAECNFIALRAIEKHREDGGKCLASWVFLCVRNWLLPRLKSQKWRNKMGLGITSQATEDREVEESFSLSSLLLSVSKEAGEAITVALDEDLRAGKLKKVLRKRFGWEWSLINKVFQEVREAL
jgi:DNA-directed RNA polymerase specialized sigma24 family protein